MGINRNKIPLRTVDLTFILDTNAYVSGDLLADTATLAAVVSADDALGYLVGFTLIDEDDQAAAIIEVVFMDQTASVGTFNNAAAFDTGNLDRNILGVVTVEASRWIDLGGSKLATITMQNAELPMLIKPASGTDDIGIALVTRGTPTQTASGIRGRFYFQDCTNKS